jgi:hypothetical protein
MYQRWSGRRSLARHWPQKNNLRNWCSPLSIEHRSAQLWQSILSVHPKGMFTVFEFNHQAALAVQTRLHRFNVTHQAFRTVNIQQLQFPWAPKVWTRAVVDQHGRNQRL